MTANGTINIPPDNSCYEKRCRVGEYLRVVRGEIAQGAHFYKAEKMGADEVLVTFTWVSQEKWGR